MSKSVDTSQSTSSNTDEGSKEVATATLINLESPVSTSEAAPVPTASEDQLDSIEASEQWHNARMQASTASAVWVELFMAQRVVVAVINLFIT